MPVMSDRKKTKVDLLAELTEARQTIANLEAFLDKLPGEPLPRLEVAFAEALASSLPGVVYLFSAEAVLLWWNRQLEQVTGFSPEELAGAPLSLFVPADNIALVRQRFRQALESGTGSVETPLVARDGRATPYYLTGQ